MNYDTLLFVTVPMINLIQSRFSQLVTQISYMKPLSFTTIRKQEHFIMYLKKHIV